MFTRLSYQGKSSDQLSISLGMEKDAGEPKYWDFVSGSLEVQKLDYLEKVILGDYYVNLGQGVALWNSFSFGKGGVQSTRIAREGRGILAKKTPSESPFFRGIAAYFTKKKLDLYVFLSRKNMSATRDTLLGGGSIFRNLSSSYLYRTASELERKGNLPRTDLGVAVQWNETYYRLGALHYQTHFKHSLNPELSQATTNSFTGSALRVSSIYYRALVANTFHLFGEMATQGKNISFLQGVSLESGDHEFSLLYRRYPTQGRYFDSNAFSEQRSVAEQGVYLSFLWYLPYDITCEMYTDLYEVLDFSHPNIFPYQGKDFWLKVSHQPLQHFLYFMQLQYERRLLQRFSVMDDLQNLLRLRFQTAWVRESFTLKWRFDYSDLVGLDQKPATAFTQDVRYTTDESLSYKFRIAIFDVSHWPLRIYSLSPAVSRSFYGVVFYRSGTHFSGVVSYKPYPGLKLETHLSLFDYWGERTISQGNNEILGSQRFYLSLQATLKI